MSNTGHAEVAKPIILAVDTSSRQASLAVSRGEEIIASISINNNLPHSQTLFPNISELLRIAGLKIQDVNVFATATGPGSFTGLRVGLAAVKGLADSLGKPCLGIDSLDLLALATGFDGKHLVMIEAGRGEVYCGIREVAAGDIINRSTDDKVGKPSLVLGSIASDLQAVQAIVTGNGVLEHKEEVQAFIDKLCVEMGKLLKLEWHSSTGDSSNASATLARRACRLLENNQAAPVKPHYTRPSDAEIKCQR
jgi:tRNA threonylcarbamoyladenosine biosynthesis protein TsaB